jgi:hypothetical protein
MLLSVSRTSSSEIDRSAHRKTWMVLYLVLAAMASSSHCASHARAYTPLEGLGREQTTKKFRWA